MGSKHIGRIGLVSTGVVIGLLLAWTAQKVTADGEKLVTSDEFPSGETVAEAGRNHEQQIAALNAEVESLKRQIPGARAPVEYVPLTDNQQLERMKKRAEQSAAAAHERDTRLLLAAGYSMEKIEWMRNRALEMQKRQRQAQTDMVVRGIPLPDAAKEMAYLHDWDIELRYEIGDEEYEKYRIALDRPIHVPVSEVLPGSITDSVGIMSGDQIVSYDHKRTFNVGELNGFATSTSSGPSIPLVVIRDGQTLHFQVPRGILGVRSYAIPDIRRANPDVLSTK